MSSLGFLTLHREVSGRPGWGVERVFLPDAPGSEGAPIRLRAWESQDPVGSFTALGVSVAHELELGSLIRLLEGLGLPPRRTDREEGEPVVVLGGPLTMVNPRLLAPFADLVVVGEGDEAIHSLCDAIEEGHVTREHGPDRLTPSEGFWWPHLGSPPPEPARADASRLPAFSERWSPDAELSNMVLVEVARGCRHACSFCCSSRLAQGPCRLLPADRILAAVPEAAPRVGLVGTAVSDHPELAQILTSLVGSGRGVGVSSVRADRLDEPLIELLQKGGLRTLTLGVDGASERLRREVHKGITAEDLLRAADLAAAAGLRRLKLYQLVGLPGETDEDLEEFARLAAELSGRAPLTITLTPFVPKPHTPLCDAEQLPLREVQRRLRRLSARLGAFARVRPDSARWASIEAILSRGDELTAEAVLEAELSGGRFSDYRRALSPFSPRRGAV
jgi:radical SAM superfamily enzyme YgiQ (UPF0313 family)